MLSSKEREQARAMADIRCRSGLGCERVRPFIILETECSGGVSVAFAQQDIINPSGAFRECYRVRPLPVAIHLMVRGYG